MLAFDARHGHTLRHGPLLWAYTLLLTMGQATSSLGQSVGEASTVGQHPRVGAYFSGVVPLWVVRSSDPETADPGFTFGFPTGINLWVNQRLAFSVEFVPSLTIDSDGTRASGLLFHPGFTWNLNAHTGISARVAFESNGQFGFTPVVGRTVKQFERSNLAVSVPFPIRVGNGLPPTFAVGLQVGWGF